MYRRSVLSFLIVAALVFAVAACDFSPTASFSGFGGEQGATLNGQFRQRGGTARTQLTAESTYGAYAALAVSSQAEPVTVMVLDDPTKNEIASVDIVNDAFTLRGLPDSFFLRFLDADNKPIGEDMFFDAVKPNQEIDIVVALRNGKVVLLEERRTGIDHQGASGIEIDGTAANVVTQNSRNDPNDLITGFFDVGDYHIVTKKGETSIRKGNRSLILEDIDGKQVHVRGIFEGDDVFAHEIKLQEDEEDDDDEIEPRVSACGATSGKITICHVPPGNPDNAKTKSISVDAWPAHAGHGDYCGPCN